MGARRATTDGVGPSASRREAGRRWSRERNDVPAGPFSYEIIGIQGRKQETLAANETYTITVFTR